MHEWRLIRSAPLPGALNMALDEALLESVAGGHSPPILRLYRWIPAAVTLGRFQPAGNLSLEACAGEGFDVVRRCTGGRLVLHDREVTYAVVSPEKSDLFPGGILENYRVIAGILRQALRTFGIETELARERGQKEGNVAGACFTAPSFAELVLDGCKMTGSAQRRQGGSFLQHGSIPVDMDLTALARVFFTPPAADLQSISDRLHRRVGWVNRWAASPVTVDEVEESLVEEFARLAGIRFVSDQPSGREWDRARALEQEKYRSPGWTLHI